MEKSMNFEIKDDFSPFLDKLQNWKIFSRKTMMEIAQMLGEKVAEEEHLSNVVASLRLENKKFTTIVTDLQETINNLLLLQEENENLKLEIRNLRLVKEKLEQDHQTVMVETKKCLDDKIKQAKQENRTVVEKFQEELQKQKRVFELELLNITSERDEVLKLIEEMKQHHKNEIQLLELDKQTEINNLKDELENAEQKLLQSNRTSMNQDIFRRKLLNLQNEYNNKIQSLTKEIDTMKKKLAEVNSREPKEKIKLVPARENPYKSHSSENDIKKEGANMTSNKKRKLYFPDSGNIFLNSSQDEALL